MAGYYNGYGYQNPYAYSPASQPQQTSGIIWVQGIEAAKSYIVGAGQSVLLMDSENSSFYIKSTDSSGMPQPIRIFDFTERNPQPVNHSQTPVDMTNYVTHDELQRMIEELRETFKKGE